MENKTELNEENEVNLEENSEDISNNSEFSQIEQLEQEKGELIQTLQRLQAEFENYRKRAEKEKLETMERGSENTIKELLPVLDTFTLALANVKEETEFTKGIELIYAQLFTNLEKFGLEKINSVNEMFDPNVHEALLTIESEKESGTVLEELQTGYKLKSKLLRPTKVKIAK